MATTRPALTCSMCEKPVLIGDLCSLHYGKKYIDFDLPPRVVCKGKAKTSDNTRKTRRNKIPEAREIDLFLFRPQGN